jgi:hypothetical protein
MTSILRFEMLIPILLIILQEFVLLFGSITVLKRLKFLKTPYAGMEYSQLLIGAAFILGVFLISTGSTAGVFQSFKSFQNGSEGVLANTFSKFSQFFMIVLLFEVLFFLVGILSIKLFAGFGKSNQVEQGNIPTSVLVAIILIGFSIVFQLCTGEIVDYITPKYINFR